MLPDLAEEHGIQMPHERIVAVRKLIASRGPRVDLLEVGSWTGNGALNWRHEISKLPEGGTVTCVDPWKPYIRDADLGEFVPGSVALREMQAALATERAYQLFLRNTSYGNFFTVPILHHRGTLSEVIGNLGKYDVIFIDGSHYYEDVKSDIELARNLLKPGGILCGDDLERQMDEVDADEVMSNLDRDYTGTYHPGVTAAVWQAFGRVPTTDAVWHLKGD